MKKSVNAGLTLVELLVAMAIASIVGAMILQMVFSFQSRVFAEIGRNDLQDRAERLIRFLASDIRDAAFLLGANPFVADGQPVTLVHDSLSGDPEETLSSSIIALDQDNDVLTIVKAVSFSPPLLLRLPAAEGDDSLSLNRRPNRSPGSSRELLPAPEAINHLVLANHKTCYPVQAAGINLQLTQPLQEAAPVSTEVLGVRAMSYQLDPFSGSNRLRRDDFTSRSILDDAVDGMQFEYLLADGTMAHSPTDPRQVSGIRISLLVRDLRSDRNFRNDTLYSLGNRTFGPFNDHYRRQQVSRLVEVKNHVL